MMPLDKGNNSNTSDFGNIAEEIPEFQLDEEIGSAVNMQTQHSLCDENHKVDEPITKKPKTEFAGLITAIRIAKWFARANGFTAHNKSLYVSQDTESRRRSIEFSQVDSRRFSDVVDENVHIREKHTLFTSNTEESKTAFVMTDDLAVNTSDVCDWIAKSYGQTDPCYHEAYNNEIFRQSRLNKIKK